MSWIYDPELKITDRNYRIENETTIGADCGVDQVVDCYGSFILTGSDGKAHIYNFEELTPLDIIVAYETIIAHEGRWNWDTELDLEETNAYVGETIVYGEERHGIEKFAEALLTEIKSRRSEYEEIVKRITRVIGPTHQSFFENL